MANQKIIPVSVIVTVLNEAGTIDELLQALAKQTVLPSEIIITDGGSTDGTREKLQEVAKTNSPYTLKVFQTSGNRSIGRNQAIQEADQAVIAITDAGCVPHPKWLEKLWQSYQEQQKPVIAGYYEAQPHTPFEEAVVPYVLVMPDRVNPDSFLPATRSMLIEKKVWSKLSGFDESLSDNEDYAFAKKIQAAGIPIGFAEAATVSWFPRTSLKSFMWMIYRFARGDIKAGIVRPKVVLIYIRALIWILISLVFLKASFWLVLFFWFISGLLYAAWAVKKNLKYVPHGWFWLPVLQVSSDVMVLAGSLAGFMSRYRASIISDT